MRKIQKQLSLGLDRVFTWIKHLVDCYISRKMTLCLHLWRNLKPFICLLFHSLLVSNLCIVTFDEYVKIRNNDIEGCTYFTFSIKTGNHNIPLWTHWGREKFATISQTTFSNAFSGMKMYEFRLRFHWSPQARIHNIPALIQIMAWRQAIIGTNDGLFTDAYMRHSAWMNNNHGLTLISAWISNYSQVRFLSDTFLPDAL